MDFSDPTAMIVHPTVLSIPSSVLQRFAAARRGAPSHTELVLDALRSHADRLPDLVLARRPGARAGDLFPFSEGKGTEGDTPGPLRIRPTRGNLKIMDELTEWVQDEIQRSRPGGRRVSRSEVVAAALDAYLPVKRTTR